MCPGRGQKKKFVALTLLVNITQNKLEKITQNFRESLTELLKIKQTTLYLVVVVSQFFFLRIKFYINLFFLKNCTTQDYLKLNLNRIKT